LISDIAADGRGLRRAQLFTGPDPLKPLVEFRVDLGLLVGKEPKLAQQCEAESHGDLL
jgi:hypothetical protein